MNAVTYDESYLIDPTVFAVNRMRAVSDHDIFATEEEAAQGTSSLRRSLNGRWKFRYAAALDKRVPGFETPEFDTALWDEIDVPGYIQLQGEGRWGVPQYVNTQYPWDGFERLRPPEIPQNFHPVGQYVRRFCCPESWAGLRTVLCFDGVESALFVWVNGIPVGYAEDSFTPSRFDITDALREGENTLAVEVYRFCTGTWLEDQDFWRFSGIFRDVTLEAHPRAHVEDVFVHARPDEDLQNAELSCELRLTLPEHPVTLEAALLDASGACVDAFALPAAPDMTFSRRIAHPALWSAENPALYTLRLTLRDAAGCAETARTELGFRRFEMKDGLMRLNGKPIRFHGVDRHEFSCKTGRAVSREEMLWDVRTLKRHNINAVRTSHYPNHPAWYRLCDRYGIYLIDETNLETHGTWQKMGKTDPAWVLPGDRPEWCAAVVDRARSMQERDKNHPCVLIWSCGNESYGGKDIFEMSEALRRRDPDRLVHYEGVCYDRRFNDTSDMESRMYLKVADTRRWLRDNSGKPFIECEYSHAMGNSCGGLSKYLELEDENPRYQGGFIWDWIDQAIEVTAENGKRRLAYGGDFCDQPTDRNFCGNGLVFADRRLTPKLQEVKHLYQNVRILPGAGGVTLRNNSLFDDLRGYFLTWTLLRDGEPDRRGAVMELCVPAGTEATLPLPGGLLDKAGEYVLSCALCLKEDHLWAERGYPLMTGQTCLGRVEESAESSPEPFRVVRGDVNISAQSDRFQALFSLPEGGLVRLAGADGRTVLNWAARPSLYRAPTDNDRGNGSARSAALWQAFTLLSAAHPLAVEAENGLSVSYRFDLPSLTDAAMDVAYTVVGDGRIKVSCALHASPDLPDLPALGLSFRLPGQMSRVRYYGLGPDENYVDRCEGALLGVYRTTVRDMLVPYLKPQECGNREGIRWLEVTDASGRGLRVRMTNRPLSVKALPYSAEELSAALHQDELPDTCATYLDVAMARGGIAGDDSWGAPVLEEYRLHAGEYAFSFLLELI